MLCLLCCILIYVDVLVLSLFFPSIKCWQRFCLGLRLTQEINFFGNPLDISNWADLANCPYSLFCNETGYFQLLHVTANKYDIKGNLGDSITTYLGFALVGGLTAPPMFSDDAELTNRTNFLN
uniref:Uncharacterized protein n=1 Tax=Glossina palpalis gambiensis TaxID=67801 RepID=A0A1B0BHI2_9MUSC